MGRIVVTEFVSLDGVMQDPGGAEDFKYGGWSFEFSRGEEGDKFKYDEVLDSDALLLGRVTYDGFADAWPQREGDFADRFNNLPKYVVGSKADASRWTNTTALDRGPAARARAARRTRWSRSATFVARRAASAYAVAAAGRSPPSSRRWPRTACHRCRSPSTSRSRSVSRSPAAAPRTWPTATARPSTAAGSWRTASSVRATRSSYQARIWGQSVSAALTASSCRAAMAASIW